MDKQTSWSISGGSANYDFLSDAKYIRQTLLNGGFVSGKTYKINFEITSGTAYMNVNSNGGGLISLNTYSVGSYSIYVTASASGSDLLIYGRNTSGTAFSIDNVSVREVGQDWNLIGTATITENQANIVTTSAVTGISQSNILTIGKSYKLSYNIVSNNNGGLKISGNEIPSVVGNNIYYFEASAAALEILRNSGITDISITNISVKEVGQNWTLGTGWSIGDDVAIFDYDTSISKIFTSNLNLNLNNSYRLSFEIKNVLSGTPNIFIGNSGGGVGYNGNYTNYSEGVHTLIFSPSSNQTTLSFFARYSDFSITNISLIEITTDTNLPRINYEGFSYQDALGSELVVNGNWYSHRGADFTINNNLIYIENVGNTYGGIEQSFVVTANKIFKLKYNVTQGTTSTDWKVDIGSTQGASDLYSKGQVSDFTENTTITSNSNQIWIRIYNNTPTIGDNFSIDNVSVKEVTGQEVVPDSGCGSWLFEPQSTNLIEYSNDYADAYWIKATSGSGIAPVVTSNYAISPDGTQNADRIQFDATTSGSNGDRSRIRTTLSLTDTSYYTFSFYAKSTDGTDQKIGVLFDNSQIETFTITDEWQRFEATQQQFGTSSTCGLDLRSGNAFTSDILVYGIQLEEQSYATSYIPTSGSSVTRNQDLCTNGGSLASINSTEGVLYAEIAALADGGTFRGISLNDGTTNNNNVIRIYCASADNRITIIIRANGSLIFNYSHTLTSITDFNKIAIKYKQNDFSLWVNGINIHNQTTGNTPIGLNELLFNNGLGTEIFFGKTKALAVWKEALSDAELTELTTI